MATMSLTVIDAPRFIILGIENGQHEAAATLAKDLLKQLEEKEKEEKNG